MSKRLSPPAVGAALLVTAAQLGWATLMLGAAVFKLADSGAASYVRHYTNWSWTLQLLFYYASAPAPLLVALRVRGAWRDATLAVVAFGLLPLNGVVWVVASVVSVLLASGHSFIDRYFAEHAPSLVVLGNDVYHLFPLVALLLYVVFNARIALYAVNELLRAERCVFFLYAAYGGTLISLLVYLALFDPHVVYSTELPFAVGGALALFVLTAVNALPLAVAVGYWRLGERALGAAWLERRRALSLADAVPDQ